MDLYQAIIAGVYFIFGGVFLFLAYTIIRDNSSQRLNRMTGMMLVFAALGPIFLALGTIIKPNVETGSPFEESVLYNLHYTWEFFFPAFLLFALIFPVDRLSEMKRPKLKYVLFLPYLFHMILVVVFKNPEKILNLLEVESGEGFLSIILEPLSYIMKWLVLGFSLLLSSENTLFSIINLIYVMLAVGLIIRGRMLITDKRIRDQTFMIILGILIAIGIYSFAFLIPVIFSYDIGDNLKTILLIAVLFVGGGSITWSVVRNQFLDVRVIFRQSLVYTISSGILVGIYVLLIGLGGKFISSYFGGETTILNIAFIIAALILFQPINIRLDNLIKRWFIKSGGDYRNIMEELSRRFISIFDPEQLRATIENSLKSAVRVEKVYFVIYDDILQEYALLSSKDYTEQKIVDREDLFLGGVNQLVTPATFDMMRIYKEGSPLAAELKNRHIDLILPLKDADHLLGFLALTEKSTGFKYNAEDITLLGVISNLLVTALTNARLYADSLEKQRLDEEMSMARQIQLDLLPDCPPAGDNYDICIYSKPSRRIGGDFYDFIEIENGRFGLVIADAAGKGLPAALMVAQIQATLRSEVGNNSDISKILYNVNRHVADSTASEKYATLFYGEYDESNCEFSYSNAGHNYPILVRADGSYELLSEGGIVIGAFSGTEFKRETAKLDNNDLIFFYTDGISEAMDDSSEEFGEQRVRDFVINNRHLNADELVDGIINTVREFDHSDPPRDDTTVIVLKVCHDNSGG
jgi:serine phosphatase RsbU (regulator of sigma subunit)